MLKWIEKTRKKPKAVRDQYAFFGALVLTGIIVVGWSFSLPARLESLTQQSEDDTQDSQSAFGQFFKNAKEQAAAAFDAGRSAVEQETDTVEIAPAKEDVTNHEQSDPPAAVPTINTETPQSGTMNDKDTTSSRAIVPRTVRIATTSDAASTSPDAAQ